MRRVLWLLLCGLLVSDLTGAIELFSPEDCPPGVSQSQPDANCPPTCARCACCAQPLVQPVADIAAGVEPTRLMPPVVVASAPTRPPIEVLHVPKYS